MWFATNYTNFARIYLEKLVQIRKIRGKQFATIK